METLIASKDTTRKKYFDPSWNFETADTKELTHCFHSYPAMMIPQVARRLIEKYGMNANLLFDPYCGTGTSLVEANIHGINAIGTDLNPLARLIAKAKTTPLDEIELDAQIADFQDKVFALKFGKNFFPEAKPPDFFNIDFWFTKEVQKKLAKIKNYIKHIQNSDIQRFFQVAFSETVRESSLTRNSEFKLYRMPEKVRENFNPDVFAIMLQKLLRNRKGLSAFNQYKGNLGRTAIYDFNTVVEIPDSILAENSVDLIVTSPPYGDSRTTVAYGQFSRLANQWLGFEDASKLDNRLMGGKANVSIRQFNIPIVDRILEELNEKDEKRAKDVYAFYNDYFKSIKNIAATVKSNGYVCFVVGNRRVKAITLPTDEITVAFFEANGFEHLETIVRKIPSKRMPSKNSPTNQIGKTDTTMNFEYIVVLRKK